MAIYEDFAETADSLLKEFGREIEVRREVTSFNPIESTDVITESKTYKVNGVVLKAGISKTDTEKRIVGNYISGEIKSCLLSTIGSTFVPEVGDQILFNGKNWTIEGLDVLSPASIDVIYKVLVKLNTQPGEGFEQAANNLETEINHFPTEHAW